MIDQPHLLPECYADTLLVNMLIRAEANHKRSISQVFVALKEDFKNRKAIGVIDDDKAKDDYYKEFNIESESQFFRHLKHPNDKHQLIVLKKDFEWFIMRCAASVAVEHKLLKDIQSLKKVTKAINIGTNSEFKNLLNTLIQKKAAPLMQIQQILLAVVN